MAVSLTPEAFEELVDRALDQVPDELLGQVDNCILVIEDRAPASDPGLFGYYEGTPLSERDSQYAGVLPDRIVIFRETLLEACKSPEELAEEVRITVWHEIAHYFGIDDDELDQWGYA